jgi:SAM-dependent methyltransferase
MNLTQRLANRLHRKRILAQTAAMRDAPAEQELRRALQGCATIVDLGCGDTPLQGATAAVDLFTDARQRGAGTGNEIQPARLEQQGIQFVRQSIDERLPFADGSFDFAYCSHAIEHVEHPGRACNEMMRVAKQGLLRCPAVMAEYLYGREYHRWIALRRGQTVLFVEKTPEDFNPFGSSTDRNPRRFNPFEALLDWHGQGPRTPGHGIIGRLKRTLQANFYGRSALSEVNLFWTGRFAWVEMRKDGSVTKGGGTP